jgi:hypothetical protein
VPTAVTELAVEFVEAAVGMTPSEEGVMSDDAFVEESKEYDGMVTNSGIGSMTRKVRSKAPFFPGRPATRNDLPGVRIPSSECGENLAGEHGSDGGRIEDENAANIGGSTWK